MEPVDRLIALARPHRSRSMRGNLDFVQHALDAVDAADRLPGDDLRRVVARTNLCEVVYHVLGPDQLPESIREYVNLAGALHGYADRGYTGEGSRAAREIGLACLRIGDYLCFDSRVKDPRERAFVYYSYAAAFAGKWGLRIEEAQALYHWASVRIDSTGNTRLREARSILLELAGTAPSEMAEPSGPMQVVSLWREIIEVLTPLQMNQASLRLDGVLCAVRHLRYWSAYEEDCRSPSSEFFNAARDLLRQTDPRPPWYLDVFESFTAKT